MIRFALILALSSAPAFAQNLDIAGGKETAREVSQAATVRLPRAPWQSGQSPRIEEGALRKRAFRIGGSAQTTLQILAPLSDRLTEAGFDLVFSCDAATCGGFDFRFDLDLLGEPDMHVDLGDYRYLLAENPTPASDSARLVSLVVSRDSQAGFVHITEVFEAALPAEEATRAPNPSPQTVTGLVDRLQSTGHASLPDLDFASGSADLGGTSYQSLADLAEWLLSEPNRRVAIVGHTDAVGGLDGNTALSRRRAESVLARLRDIYAVDPAQLEAHGVGYLAPIASNLTEEGRAANRRVEVVLLNTEAE